nr:hypothetical protein [Tanacetum cinerariifolium]
MVAYLTKSDASEGFNQVIDFLNASYIKYALTINPYIYVSCIKQFWNTVIVKQSNDVTRLQALVDKKKVLITKATIRDALRLDDAEGVDCLPNEEIFAELARICYEKPSTKLTFYKAFFSSHSAMASAVICLSTGRKFNFSKYIFESLKVFANMRRMGKEFSGVKTHLLEGMIVAGVIEEEGVVEEQVLDIDVDDVAAQGADTAVSGDDVQDQYIPSPTPPILPPQQSQNLPSISQALEIKKLKRRVKKLEKGNKIKVSKLIRLQKVGTSQRIDTLDDIVMEDASNQGRMIDVLDSDARIVLMDDKKEEKKAEEDKVAGDDQVQGRQAKIYKIDMDHALKVLSMQEDEPEVQELLLLLPEEEKEWLSGIQKRNHLQSYLLILNIDWDVAIDHVKQKAKEDPFVQRYQVIKKRPQTEAKARRNMIMYLKNVAGFRLDYFKRMSYDDIRLIFEAKFNSNMEFLLKTKKQMKEEKSRAIQSINETSAQKAAKRRKLNEEVEDLKRHLEIVLDEDDDAYTEATPLARKVPVVDYEIIHLNNKPHYKIIRADGTHQLYLILLVERRYPLLRFTLDQMLNAVRLRVEEQSEMSLELLRFTRQQYQEGQIE